MDYQQPNDVQPQQENTVEQPALREFKTIKPVKQVKIRRVGTLTLGISLVTTGILLLCNMLIPNFPLLAFVKFAPLVLVLTGLEILLYSFFAKGEKLRYDFLSMLFCLLLIGGSIGLTVIPTFAQNAMQAQQIESQIESRIHTDVYEALKGESIQDVYISFYLDEVAYPWTDAIPDDLSYQDLNGAYLSLDITLNGSYDSPEAFAEATRKILDELEPLHLPEASYYVQDNDYTYHVSLNGYWEKDASVEQLTDMIDSYQ